MAGNRDRLLCNFIDFFNGSRKIFVGVFPVSRLGAVWKSFLFKSLCWCFLLFRNLLFLRAYSGDVSSLGLNFTIVNNDIGQKEVVELKPGGANIAITNENCAEYIAAVADYKLNKQVSGKSPP